MAVDEVRGDQAWAWAGDVEVVRTALLSGEMEKPEGGAG